MKIEWYGPPSGEKSVEHTVSYSVPVASALMRYSAKMAQEARQVLEVHRDDGDSKIGVVHRDGRAPLANEEQWLDSIVYLTDRESMGEHSTAAGPDGDGARSAAAIEASIGPLKHATKKMIRSRRLSIK